MPFPEVEQPTNTKAAQTDPNDAQEADLLTLAETDPEAVVKKMREEWDRSWDDIKDLNEQWKVNMARSDGYIGARLDKTQDKQEAFVPYGAGPSITGLNRAVRLSRNLRSMLFADPPLPDVVPNRGVDVDADKAQFQSRILKDESERLSYTVLVGDAFEVGKDYGSGFIEFYIDPEGRGPQPVRIKAHPDATDANDPMLEEARAAGQPVEPKAATLRYVTEDGGLTDDRYSQPLQHQFLPKVCADVLNGRHVRMLPGTSRDIWDASVVLIGAMVPLGNVKSAFPEIANLPDDRLAAIVSYRPTKARDLLPIEQRRYLNHSKIDDTALVFLLKRFELPNGKTRKGSYFAAVGDTELAYHGTWWDEEHDEPLDLPVTQIKQHHQHGNPYGTGSMELLGPGNELLAIMLDAMLEHLDRHGDSKTFVPMTSNLRPEQLEAETHRYIPFSGATPPVPEIIPDFPVVVEKFHARITQEMDAESGLQQAGQALQGANVTSARQFQANLNQVSVLLSDLRDNATRGIVRGWKIIAQLVRAYYSIPQLLQWEGEDGAYHVKEWAGSDLVGTADVRIAQGSFSQMVPAQKAALAKTLYLEDKTLTPQEYRRIVTSAFDPILALQDDPHFQRVKRQVDRWLDGPPQGWQPPVAPTDPMTGQPAVDPQTGQPVPPAPDPVLSAIFAPRPCDDEQAVAARRVEEISRVMATTRFEKFPPAWQQGLIGAYQQARMAAGIATVAEQQQAAQQQAQGQAQVEQAKAQGAQAKAQADQVKAQTDIQKAQIQSESNLAEAELRKQGELLDVQAARAAHGTMT